MKKIFIALFSLFKSKKTKTEITVKEDLVVANEGLEDYEQEYFNELELRKQKAIAISKCGGCSEKVFVLKVDNKEISYHHNLNDLSVKNGFHASSVYRYIKEKRDGLFLNKYEITNLE